YSPIREAQAQQVLLHLRLDSRGAAVPEHEIHLGKCGNNNQDDPSPTFRRSCRDVICGSCAMNIDGDHGLVCFTEIPSFCRACTVEPWLKIARRIGRSWTGRTSLSSAPAAAPSIPAIGGILRLISRPRPSSTPTVIHLRPIDLAELGTWFCYCRSKVIGSISVNSTFALGQKEGSCCKGFLQASNSKRKVN
ncbi:hypothetical protein GW17_00023434, partial [Ensete ventricosum]